MHDVTAHKATIDITLVAILHIRQWWAVVNKIENFGVNKRWPAS
jgi:hypothetical protein